MSTLDNLMSAFAGESQANRKYLAFAKKAEAEGYHAAAKMFKAAAEAETIHAHTHLNAAEGVKSTEENLKAAVSGETFEFEKMYPPFLEEAKKEGNKKATLSFTYAMAAEKVHADLFQEVLSNLSKDDTTEFYLCPVCGYVHKNGTPNACPICSTAGSKFIKID
ncbi:rubrerythrin [endosymbiont 'TC1' of Trimyema compressum]|uniref:rubrerythrin family protein n=1 Tax=endosymbiont 'TC1' of Trimyema compressum TaxID=243899 RepID=UPI0007F12B34|nr:rubrerythrin family protein [endosymbiont 'TC1' of Trimyema compressum]AMP20902.1 rubrerythrin [endosymbiont 'TC1' of Trimyema compressum]